MVTTPAARQLLVSNMQVWYNWCSHWEWSQGITQGAHMTPQERLKDERQFIAQQLTHRFELPPKLSSTISSLHKLGGPLYVFLLGYEDNQKAKS